MVKLGLRLPSRWSSSAIDAQQFQAPHDPLHPIPLMSHNCNPLRPPLSPAARGSFLHSRFSWPLFLHDALFDVWVFSSTPSIPSVAKQPQSVRLFSVAAAISLLQQDLDQVISPPFPPISRKPTRRLASSSISGHGISLYFPSSQLEEEVHKGPINGDFPKVGFEEKYKW